MKVSQTVVIVPNGTFQTFLPPHVEPAVKGQSNEIFYNSFFFSSLIDPRQPVPLTVLITILLSKKLIFFFNLA